jgi:tetratricopeptide (TPR) repeat protein
VFDGEAISKDVQTGVTDYQRGLCLQAFGKKDEAGNAFRAALAKSPTREDARSLLVNIEAEQNNFSALAQIARDYPITASTDDRTILLMAGGLDKAGSTKEAISLLQSALKLKSPNPPVYLTLASYYRQLGDTQTGDDLERKGHELAATQHP